jgi:hypothetical protein
MPPGARGAAAEDDIHRARCDPKKWRMDMASPMSDGADAA